MHSRDLIVKWIEALRSGKYKKGKYSLKYLPPGQKQPLFCCLGVLAEIAGVKQVKNENSYCFTFDNGVSSSSTLSEGFAGLFEGAMGALMNLNDIQEKSFKDIADYIEEEILPIIE